MSEAKGNKTTRRVKIAEIPAEELPELDPVRGTAGAAYQEFVKKYQLSAAEAGELMERMTNERARK